MEYGTGFFSTLTGFFSTVIRQFLHRYQAISPHLAGNLSTAFRQNLHTWQAISPPIGLQHVDFNRVRTSVDGPEKSKVVKVKD